jgi:hypothetical protein
MIGGGSPATAARFCSTVKPAAAIAANIAGMPPAITRNLPSAGDQKALRADGDT